MSQKLEIKLRGNESDSELMRLSEFLTELHTVNNTLKSLDRHISKSQSSLDFRISNLGLYSPATIEVEAISKRSDIDFSTAVIEKFINGIKHIKNREVPYDFDYDLLERFSEIGKSFKNNLTEIIFISNGNQVELTNDLSSDIKEILGEDEISYGSVSGILEALNVHGQQRKFTIYPIAGAKKIECNFPDDLFEIAITSVRKYLNLRGKVKHKKRAKFPYSINVENIEVYPDEKDLPTILDIRGIAPNATGNLNSEDFIKRIRKNA